MPIQYKKGYKTRPERNHFVSASYLQRFVNADTGMLVVFDIEKKEWRNQKPDEIMFVKNYNRQEWVPKGVDPYIFEKALSNLESNASNVIDKFTIDSKNLTENEIINFTVYLSYLRTGVPRQARTAKAIFENVILATALQNPEIASAVYGGDVQIMVKNKESRFYFMRQTLAASMYFILNMRWRIIHINQGLKLITSDSPVSLYNQKIPPPNEAGIGLVGTKLLFPLSPTHSLLMSHPEYDENSSVDPLKKLHAKPLEELDEGQISIEYEEVKNEKFVEMTNALIAVFSDRYLVGANKIEIEKSMSSPLWHR